MSKLLKIVNSCKKQKMKPEIALATIALLFHGSNFSNSNIPDEEIFDYCEFWVKENGAINYANLIKYIKNLGYVGEIVEISMSLDSTPL